MASQNVQCPLIDVLNLKVDFVSSLFEGCLDKSIVND